MNHEAFTGYLDECEPKTTATKRLRGHLPFFFASAAASSRNFAMVAADESFRFLLFCRRLVLVV